MKPLAEMDLLSDTISKAGKARRPVPLSFDEMPEWFQCSAHASFYSWLYMHNETVNIYSHLIPAVLFLLGDWRIQQYLASRYSGFTSTDFIAFSIFVLTATCWVLWFSFWATLSWEHILFFWCEPLPRNIYWCMVNVTIFLTMHPKFQGSKYRIFRALMCVATGLKAFPYTLAKAGCLLPRTLFYVTRFPEMVCAAVVQTMGYLDAFDYAQSNLACMSL
ncbi:hypothetical protein BDW71DRAFT_200870 [Aspergillus fruticulosus]